MSEVNQLSELGKYILSVQSGIDLNVIVPC